MEVRQLHQLRVLRSSTAGRPYRGTATVELLADYRFLLRPRWLLFHVVCIAGVVLMINLGFWQLRRLDERQAFNARVEERIDLPAAALDDVLAGGDADGLEWRSVTAGGEYLAEEQLVVVNRTQAGQAGDIVVTPLRLDDGRLLLVERGFVPLGTTAGPPPTGPVEVQGRLRPSEVRRRGGLSDPASGDLDQVQRLDIARLAPQLPGDVVDVYVELTGSTPAEAGPFPRSLDPPQLTEGSHLSYSGQWFIFSAGVVVGWVLALRHSVRTRRARMLAEAKGPSPSPADGRAREVVGVRPPSPG
ncbi:MAG: SURF1 family cytochrome oxidase biogenesis protein [Ilumatobacteraceae bacterium]